MNDNTYIIISTIPIIPGATPLAFLPPPPPPPGFSGGSLGTGASPHAPGQAHLVVKWYTYSNNE